MKMLWLLSHHNFCNNRHIQVLFVGGTGSRKVNVNFVAFFRALGCYVLV